MVYADVYVCDYMNMCIHFNITGPSGGGKSAVEIKQPRPVAEQQLGK